MPWYKPAGANDPDPAKPKNDGVIELTPEKVNDNINAVKTDLETKITALGDNINNHPTLLAMKEFLDSQKAAGDAEEQERQRLANASRQKGFENLDPTARDYVDQQLRPVAQAALWQQGNEMRRTIFDDAENFPYYTGTLKAKIDELLDKQSAEARANPDVIRNVYKIVSFDHSKEIEEGKHRSRLSSAVNPGTGTGAQGAGADPNALPTLTAAEKDVARRMGMKESDYAQAKKELDESYV